MKTSTASHNNHSDIARELSILSLIVVHQGPKKVILKKVVSKGASCKKLLSLPLAWLGILCCLFIFQTSADESAFLSADIFKRYGSPVQPPRNLDTQSNKLSLGLTIKGGNKPIEVGYQFLPKWQVSFESIEIGSTQFFNLSEFDGRNLGGAIYHEEMFDGWGAKVGYTAQLSNLVSSQIYVGGYHWQEQRQAKLTEAPSSVGISPYAGIGVRYRLSDNVNVKMDWYHFEIKGDGFDQLGIYLDYKF